MRLPFFALFVFSILIAVSLLVTTTLRTRDSAPPVASRDEETVDDLSPFFVGETTLQNQPPPRVQGTLVVRVETSDRRPVACRVSLHRLGEDEPLSTTEHRVSNDARFEAVSPGSYEVRVTNRFEMELGRRAVRWDSGTETVVFQIPVNRQIAGVVVDESGRAVAGAEVQHRSSTARWSILDAQERETSEAESLPLGPSVRTDALGEFELDELAPGRYRLEVTHPAYRRGMAETVAGAQDVEIVLSTAEVDELRGRVVDRDGYAVSGAQVRRTHGDDVLTAVDTTDANGEFEVDRRGSWHQCCVISAPGFAPKSTPFPADPKWNDDWEIVLDPEVIFVGSIEDENGRPIAGAEVRVRASGTYADRRVRSTGPTGGFEIPLDVGGVSESWEIRREGFLPLALRVTTESSDGGVSVEVQDQTFRRSSRRIHLSTVESKPPHGPLRAKAIVLERARRLRGLVQATNGEPVADAAVGSAALPPDARALSSQIQPWFSSDQVWTDARGEFEIEIDPEADHPLWIRARGHRNRKVDSEELEAAGEFIEIELESERVLRGQVQDDRGVPLAGAVVKLRNDGVSRGFESRFSATVSDARGVYEFFGLREEETYRLDVEYPPYGWFDPPPFVSTVPMTWKTLVLFAP